MIVRDTLLYGEQDQALKELTNRRTTVTARTLRPKVQQMYQRAAKDVKGWLDKKAVEARKSKDKSETGKVPQKSEVEVSASSSDAEIEAIPFWWPNLDAREAKCFFADGCGVRCFLKQLPTATSCCLTI